MAIFILKSEKHKVITSLLKSINIERLITPIMPLGAWYLRVSPRMITCREFNDFVYDYTEGLLSDKQTILFERHMRICPMCRNFLKTYQTSLKAGKAFFPYTDKETPNTVPDDLLDAIRDVYKK